MKHKFYRIVVKRSLDIFFSFIAIVLLIPLFLIIFIWVKIDSKGPAFFVQERLSLHGKTFKMIKFRTMCVGAEKKGTGVYSFDGDPRITRAGKILRKTSLDELPQLFNIFIGDMSFIGPRPVLTYHPCKYEEYSENEKQVFSVRPGITGWAQVNGRNTVDWVQRFSLNQWYVENISFFLDLKIFFKTIAQVFSRKETVIQEETAKEFKKNRQNKDIDGE